MKIKKILTAGAVIGSLALFSAASASAIDVYVDNVKTALGNGTGQTVEPFIQDGTTYVPLRGVSEALGCRVKWDGDNHTVMVYQNMSPSGETFRNWEDYIRVYIDDEEVELKDANGGTVRPFIIDGTTFIPLRGISQALGCQVEWDGSLQRVSIYQDTVSPNGATLDFVRPYELDWVDTYYESNGESLDIDGTKFTNALNHGWWGGTGEAFFNINSKYDSMTFTIGHTDDFDTEKTVEFIVDGKNVKTCSVEPNERPYDVTVSLNKGLQLKIVFKQKCIGLGDIVFH